LGRSKRLVPAHFEKSKMKNITPLTLAHLVHKKLGKKISFKHVKPVVMILLDELKRDLIEDRKTLVIENFAKIRYSLPKPRKYFSFITRKIEESQGNPLFKFELFKFIRKRIISLVDIDKTFGTMHDGTDEETAPK